MFPYLLFWRETYLQTFPPEFLSLCQHNSWKKLHINDLSKIDILQGFVRRKWWTINIGKTARETYSNYNQARAYVEWSSNQSKKLYLIDLSIEQSTKLWRFRKSTGRFCIWILPEYCSSALQAHAYKIVLTTVWSNSYTSEPNTFYCFPPEYNKLNLVQHGSNTAVARCMNWVYVYKYTAVSVIRESLSISVRRWGDIVARFCQTSRNVFENKMTSFQWLLTPRIYKLSVNMT